MLILASQSPRRRELLSKSGYKFEVCPPSDDAETAPQHGERPQDLVARLARDKAANVATRQRIGLILGCDTVADCDGTILGKPRDRGDAARMLRLLRGREHSVHSGLCLWQRPSDTVTLSVDTTTLFMQPISDAELEEYLDTGLWKGKAGAFGYQDRTGWLEIVTGSESNVVGLPLELLGRELAKFTGDWSADQANDQA